MRSLTFTILLALLAFVTGSLAVMRMSEGGLSSVFGLPASDIGGPLYDFDANQVVNVYLLGNGTSAHCIKGPGGWELVKPWKDRMDPRAAQAIFGFALGTQVEGAIPTDKVESENLQFEDGRVGFGFTDKNGDTLSKFILDHKTAWVGTDPATGDPIPTVFVSPRDKGRKDYYYACTDPGDIHSLLADGFKKLRDHHPFLFHPTIVQSLRVKNRSGEMVLSRKHPKELWSIVKPLGLKSDKASLVSLLQGIYDLKAVNVKDRSSLTLPDADSKDIQQIALKFFTGPDEVVLDVYPPETPDALTVLATISNRPNAIFELPVASSPDPAGGKAFVGIKDLPLSVNALRDPTLTAIDVGSLKSIMISPANGEDIIIQRANPADRFSILLDGEITEPSETALFSLIKTVTESKVAEFVSDTATDLKPYGLDDPFLVLRFGAFDGSRIRLDFGQGEDGTVHAIREGSTTVVSVDPSMLTLIPTQPWEWRDRQLLRIGITDVTGIERMMRDHPPLELTYDFGPEKWTAREKGKDRSVNLVKKRADLLLDDLLDLRVDAWLRPGHTIASKTLAAPQLAILIQYKDYDDEGEFRGSSQKRITIAPAKGGAIYYGQLDGEKHPFILSTAMVERLRADLFQID